jgi:serine protease AprX
MITLDALHNLGFSGQGMMIAVLDAGFYHVDQISAFDSLWLNNRILGTRDFNLPGNNVFGDNMHTHGTSVLSIMGGNLPGQMVGTAPNASFWLIRTEAGDYEALIEEYNWVGGAEFADSLGVDVINSSLGYTTFDNPVYNHSYADMDGNTTPVTRAADLATSRGIMVVNSAGNEGNKSWHYIGAPADGDSVLSIGAVDPSGTYASFSSTGPTYDRRIKPDVTAQGQGTTVVDGGGWVVQGSGTSFSSPVVAGAMACLWQSVPTFSAQVLRDAVRSTASRASSPDSLYGYGIPNMMNAMLLLSNAPTLQEPQQGYSLFPVPFSDSPWIKNNRKNPEQVKIEILSVTGQLIGVRNIYMNSSSTIALNDFDGMPSGLYFVRIISNSGQQILRAIKL